MLILVKQSQSPESRGGDIDPNCPRKEPQRICKHVLKLLHIPNLLLLVFSIYQFLRQLGVIFDCLLSLSPSIQSPSANSVDCPPKHIQIPSTSLHYNTLIQTIPSSANWMAAWSVAVVCEKLSLPSCLLPIHTVARATLLKHKSDYLTPLPKSIQKFATYLEITQTPHSRFQSPM